uniref:Amino acid/amide ABC transporter substrate-binding protein, HAAT family n=1 Tax=Candidatus Kentrum sp. FW TaxID=2126338 RepID=A0A450TK92_9GAMM|nr:MAG: amino acid/amide ABC transporter substrate-binding protein, HAAT family [Candidatus Kentron sp. FW]
MKFLKILVAMVLTLGAAASVSAQDPIKIGVLLPYSGVFALFGEEQDMALEVALDTFGREVAGRRIELVRGDTESKPNSGLAQAKKLILKDRVDLLMGTISSAVAGAIRDYAHNSKTPFIITNAGNDQLTGSKCSPWILRTSFSNSQTSRPMGPWMAEKGYRKVFLMAFDYAAGRQTMEGFRASFTKSGGTIVGEAYPPLGETKDFGPYLAKVKAANPDAVFAFFPGGPGIKFVREYAAFGLKDKIPLFGSILASSLYVDKQGDDADGIVSIFHYVPSIDSPANHKFQRDFQAKAGRVGSEFSVPMYDTVHLIVEALKATGGNIEDRKAFIKAMHGVSFEGPRGPLRIDPATNNIIQNIYIWKTKRLPNGKMGSDIKAVIEAVQDEPNGCKL